MNKPHVIKISMGPELAAEEATITQDQPGGMTVLMALAIAACMLGDAVFLFINLVLAIIYGMILVFTGAQISLAYYYWPHSLLPPGVWPFKFCD